MSINILFFDYRDTEDEFFKNTDLSNFNIKFFKHSLNEQTVDAVSEEDKDNAMVISVFINSEITEEVINKFKNLRIISARSTGYDNINSAACIKRNIALINVMNYGASSVAQYTFGLIIALVRNIVLSSCCMKGFYQIHNGFTGRDLSGLTIGVIGTGAIGGAVCKSARTFGMNILAYDLNIKHELADKYGIQYVSLENLLQNSDIVTLHTPYTGENKNFISYKQFDIMKQCPWIINTSRGEIIDIHALKDALDNKKIKGAALDVLNCESYGMNCNLLKNSLDNIRLECVEEVQIVQEIIKYPNVIITPHIAYETQDAINYILQKTFDGIIDTIKGGTEFRIV